MTYSINNSYIEACNKTEKTIFPKYTSQLINWANQNAQGTRPSVVGQMSELFQDYLSSDDEKSVENWCEWYMERYPNAIETATDKIYAQVINLQNAIPLIDRNMVKKWVEDLVFSKTFNGLYLQKAILAYLAELKGVSYRLASPDEEAKGIDGYVGETAYSIKPVTYKVMERLSENIDVKMIYYSKTKTGIKIDVED